MRPSYLKNAALLTGADVVLRLAGMGLRIWLANALGGEGMGLYQLVLAVYSLFVTLATSGVSVAATRLMAEELSRSRAEARGMLLRLLAAAPMFMPAQKHRLPPPSRRQHWRRETFRIPYRLPALSKAIRK